LTIQKSRDSFLIRSNKGIRMTKSIGMILLCIYLIVTGLLSLTNLMIELANIILGCLAIGSGILLLLGK